jgi:hypothetical protein
MDENDKLLSHQVEIVDEIAKKIDHVTVLTGRIGKVPNIGNVTLRIMIGCRAKIYLMF